MAKPAPAATRILVVDDAPATVELLRRNLEAAGFGVLTAASVAEAVQRLDETSVDLVITDLKMPRASGMDLVRHVRENLPDSEVMMITGYASIGGAVEAVKSGAEEYLAKPFTDDELLAGVDRALEKLHRRRTERAAAAGQSGGKYGLLGDSPAMQTVYHAIPKAAASMATVLITGESGTGKEMVARAIHYTSDRSAAPFVAVNCGGIPEALLESELFGHVRGAFTGATESRAGFFQTADHGTIFLDEISETSPAMQVKLLRVLQEKEVTMVGSAKPQRVDVRIIAATNRDLQELVRKGTFRDDLFYRLNVLTVAVPPLRERGDDVVQLLHHFVAKYAAEAGRQPPALSERAVAALQAHHWPGNIRELQNLLQRLVVMNESGEIDVRDLPPLMRFTADHGRGLRSLADVEAEHIRHVLEETGGNRSRAAEILDIDRKTLREKLKRHGIELE